MESTDLKQHILKFGLLSGTISIILTILFYLAGGSLMSNVMLAGILGLLVFTVVMGINIYAGVNWKKQQGGYISLKYAFLIILAVSALSGLLSTGFNMLLYNVIDPEYTQMITEKTKDMVVKYMEDVGATEEQIEKTLADMESQGSQYSPAAQIKAYIWGILFAALFAIIAALIIKKEKPAFESLDDASMNE